MRDLRREGATGGWAAVTDPRAEFALQSALVELRLRELREALARLEAEKRWDEHAVLERVERGLAALVDEVSQR